jgi:hypothetical protein
MAQVQKDLVMMWGLVWKFLSNCHCSIGISKVHLNPDSGLVHTSIRLATLVQRTACCSLGWVSPMSEAGSTNNLCLLGSLPVLPSSCLGEDIKKGHVSLPLTEQEHV